MISCFFTDFHIAIGICSTVELPDNLIILPEYHKFSHMINETVVKSDMRFTTRLPNLIVDHQCLCSYALKFP